jgi:signal transduction histidine kinase
VCRVRDVSDDIVQADDAAAPTWQVDPRRVEQILVNLIDNARRHGGGPVAVRLATAAGRHVIEVDDAGPGVPDADKQAIFDRFVRGRAAGSRGRGDGTGLGLALVREHAVAHRGTASVVDRPGGGARFRVEFPAGGG